MSNTNSTDMLEISVFQYEIRNHIDIRLNFLNEKVELTDQEKSELEELQVAKNYLESRIKKLLS